MNAEISSPSLSDASYPPSPTGVPRDLARPTRAYRLRAWFALIGLVAFFGFYLAASAWFAWVAYHLFFKVVAEEGGGFWAVVVGLGASFLSVFMVKALLSFRDHKQMVGLEIKESEQPQLFAFLRRLAREIGAPQPYKVYLSSRVNAAVVSDLSALNLILPARRNLEIGLGLVNVLTLPELKAVLAHEFGHFAQRSMVVGRWVYVSAQIATGLVVKRDALDGFLLGLTRRIVLNPIGLLILAFGWTMRLTVWSIRLLTDAIFHLLVISQRALSRQMEFQADLVAVSVTGSDALVQALHKLQAADVALKNAWTFANSELRRGHRIPDVFAMQSTAITKLGAVLGIADFGSVPDIPDSERETYRLFKARFAQPPQMWLTHPPSFEREENCKRQYVRSELGDTSAWVLFEHSDTLREQLTAAGLKSDKATLLPNEEALRAYERTFERPALDRVYRGAYLGRPVARYADELAELYGPMPAENSLADALASLYPPSLRSDVELLRSLTEERDGLKAIRDGTLSATDGVIRFRGDTIGRRQLPAIVIKVQAELDAVAARIQDHDRRCRSAHRAAAAALGQGWDDYLTGLLALLHYAEHSEANIADARGYLSDVMSACTRQGRISGNAVSWVVTAAEAIFSAIREAFEQCQAVALDPRVAERLCAPVWPLRNVRFALVAPTVQNIGAWLQSMDQWVVPCLNLFGQLRGAALDQLLTTEAQVAEAYRKHAAPGPAPSPSAVPTDFRRRRPGTERQRDLQLDWLDRWQAAPGPLAASSRLVVAASLIVLVSLVGLTLGGHVEAQEQFKEGLEAAQSATSPADFARAAQWYRKAAEQGYAPAQNNLGILYNQGHGVPEDPARAAALFRQAAEQNDPQAQANLGFAYIKGRGVAQDLALGNSWLRRAAIQGVAGAQLGLGLAYLNGAGVEKDPKLAAQWLLRPAMQGNAVAQTNLGILYGYGNGVERDPAQAAVWYQKAAAHGNAVAQLNLGVAYMTGSGVPKDEAQAVAWFRKSAEHGNATAQANLGITYLNGAGVQKDAAQAVEWFRRAADQGNAAGQRQLGIAYANGAGVTHDASLAAHWFQKAADQGDAIAQVNLGIAYFNGSGVKKDAVEAVALFRKAAEQGNPAAEFNLGVRYLRGEGVAADRSAAISWFRKSAAQGFEPARKALGVLQAQ